MQNLIDDFFNPDQWKPISRDMHHLLKENLQYLVEDAKGSLRI